jgi:hypothetical protein
MGSFMLGLTYSLRLLRNSPGTFPAVVSLAPGIGVNTPVFSMLNFLFFQPLPVRAPDRLVVLSRDCNHLMSGPKYRECQPQPTVHGRASPNRTEPRLDFGETDAPAAGRTVALSPIAWAIRTGCAHRAVANNKRPEANSAGQSKSKSNKAI